MTRFASTTNTYTVNHEPDYKFSLSPCYIENIINMIMVVIALLGGLTTVVAMTYHCGNVGDVLLNWYC